jgi:ABC-type polar amino acid transport system ATPase subunit
MIQVRNLTKFHGTEKVLDEVSLTIYDKEVTAIIGMSGSGKSTLLRCINGLNTFNSGEVDAEGVKLAGGTAHAPKSLLALRRKVGMVFQQFNLFPHMTALQNVMSGPLYALGHKREVAEAAAKKLLDRVGLADKVNAKPGNLSGGQQQRVAIARALAVNPSAMLFDEPTSALDPQMAEEVFGVIRDLASDGRTMVIVSHDLKTVVKFATRIAIIERGQLLFNDLTENAIKKLS